MRNGVIGSTADSDSVSRGSSPFSVVERNPENRIPFFFAEHTAKLDHTCKY